MFRIVKLRVMVLALFDHVSEYYSHIPHIFFLPISFRSLIKWPQYITIVLLVLSSSKMWVISRIKKVNFTQIQDRDLFERELVFGHCKLSGEQENEYPLTFLPLVIFIIELNSEPNTLYCNYHSLSLHRMAFFVYRHLSFLKHECPRVMFPIELYILWGHPSSCSLQLHIPKSPIFCRASANHLSSVILR